MGGGVGIQTPHFSERWFRMFAQKCNEIGLSGGVSQINCFCHVIK